jgi:hypothetical protein
VTAREELRAAVEGKPPTVDHAAALTALLGLDTIGRKVTSASIFGRGPDALVDIHLDNGERIAFARFADITKHPILNATLITTLGAAAALKAPEAALVAVTVHKLAKHHDQADEDTVVRDYGVEFLRFSPSIDVAMSDRAERWGAFRALANMNPASDAGEDRSAAAYAACGTILIDTTTETRYIRAGWFQQYVKREAGGLYNPTRLVQAMLRVGWERPNSQGRVKATDPDTGRQLAWPFFTVAADWEDGPVIAGGTQTRAHDAREHRGSPAITATPEEPAEAPRRHVDGTAYDEPPAWMPRPTGGTA